MSRMPVQQWEDLDEAAREEMRRRARPKIEAEQREIEGVRYAKVQAVASVLSLAISIAALAVALAALALSIGEP